VNQPRQHVLGQWLAECGQEPQQFPRRTRKPADSIAYQFRECERPRRFAGLMTARQIGRELLQEQRIAADCAASVEAGAHW
jgi:hypothetical protein